ncbi:WhiB family transcriptional regulator [Streptomyces galilaeus]|uniref:WhiB family transcriptional regulator n=1 Tax=Streptomyces galilaeus TaxID=33899 RepID=UPI0038F62C25
MIRNSHAAPDTAVVADWRQSGACRAEDPEDFFPVGATPAAKATERHAKAVCFRCPSSLECGQWALQTRQPFGIWGGMTEAERAKILRRRGIRLKTGSDTA